MNPQQSPLDYLNQIAPTQTKSSGLFGSKLMLFALIGVVAVVLVIILSVVLSSAANAKKESWAQLAVKLDTVSSVSESSTSKLKSSQLRSANSTVKIFSTNTKRDLTPYLTANGYDAKKLPPALVAKEAASGINDRLEQGRLNAKYDSTYAREMAFELGNVLALLQKLYNQSAKPETKEYLSQTYDNLKPTQETLAGFSALNE